MTTDQGKFLEDAYFDDSNILFQSYGAYEAVERDVSAPFLKLPSRLGIQCAKGRRRSEL